MEISKTNLLDLKTHCNNKGAKTSSSSSWLGNGEEADSKKRKNRKDVPIISSSSFEESKKVRHSIIDDIEFDDDDDTCSGLGQKLNDGLLIPKRPRGSVVRTKILKPSVASPSGSVGIVANLKDELKKVIRIEVSGRDNESLTSSTQQIVKLNGESATVTPFHHAKTDGGDLIKPIASLDSKDQAAKLKDDIKEVQQNKIFGSLLGFNDQVAKLKEEMKEIPQKVSGADAAPVISNSTSADHMCKLNGNSKGKLRNNLKKKGINCLEKNQKQKDDSASVLGSSDLAKDERTEDLVLNNKDPCSKRNGRNRRKRKMLGSSSGTVAKKVESSVDRTELDPDDDLEQNAARMLSSRFDPSCTGFASTNTTLPLLSANGESLFQKPTGNVGSEVPIAESDPASAEAADRVLRARPHQKGKGTSRKRRHFYEMHSDDMDAHWFLNRKIKIFWLLDERWYYGLVDDYDAERNLHHLKYADRDEEWINLENERFKLLLLPSEVPCKSNSNEDNASEGNHNDDINEDKRPNGNEDNASEGNHDEDINEDKRSLSFSMKDESFMASHMESEPIISWLARSSPRVKSSTSYLKKQKLSHFSSDNSLDVCNSRNIGLLKREVDKPNCSSAFLNISLDRRKNETFLWENTNSSEGNLPVVYVRRRCRRFSAAALWLSSKTDVLKLDTTLIESKKFKICISLWPMLTYILGADILWLMRNVLLLRYGTMVTMWPTVFLEVLFVDNIVGLRLFLFEGCLKKAVVFVFLVMKVFCGPEKDESINQQVPTTSIRFKLSFFKNFKKQKVFAFYSFSKVRDSNWKYLDSEFQPHCLLTKQLSLSDCTYDNIKLLEAGTQHSQIPYAGQMDSFEVFCKKSNFAPVPLLTGSRSSNHAHESRPLTIYSLKCGNLPPFALSFTSAPSFFVSLHLKLLLERSFSLQDYADDCGHVQDQLEISSESSSKSHEESLSSLCKDSAVVSIDGGLRKSSELVLDANFDVDKASISSKSAQTVSDEIKNLDKYQDNNQPSQVFEFSKDPARSSNLLEGISVEIPTSDEFCRELRTPGAQQVSDLTWNLSDGIIYCPNPTTPRSLWHHNKSGSSSPHGDPWADGKTDFIGNGFGNGPKKPRTQVQYTLPSRELSFKDKGHNQTGHPYQRIRKANDGRTPDVSKGPRRNLELVACDTNILINGGEKGWRECGARVFLEAADQNEWKLAVKCSGDLKYSCKVHQDLQPGSTNRYTHAMMWKGGKDWALEFPDRSQWILFKEMHEECHNRNIRASSIKNIPIPGVRLIDDWFDDEEDMPFTRSPWYLCQVRNDVEMAMDASRVMYDMDSEDEEWVSRSRMQQKQQAGEDMISDELFEKVMDMLEKVSYAQKRDHFTSGEIEELIAKVSAMQVAKSIYEHWREKRQRKGMPLIRQLQPPLWERYQQICREWVQLHPKLTTGALSGSQEKASAGDKPPMFAFCLKPRGLELLNKGSKHRPHKKISLSGHNHPFLGDHDTHHYSGRRVNTYPYGDERVESSDVSPLLTKIYSPRDACGPGHLSLDGDWNHQLRYQRNNSSQTIRSVISPKTAPTPSTFRKSGRTNGKKSSYNSFGDWHNQPSPFYRHPGQLVLGGSDLDEFKLRDASSAAKHARIMAKLKRERAQKLMLSADLAIHKAVSALMTAEAIKACTEGPSPTFSTF